MFRKTSQPMSRNNPHNSSRINPLRLLVGLLAAGLSVPALAGQSVPFPTYAAGANTNGTQGPNYPSTLPNPWVVSDGAIITPAGTQVYLGITTRAKAIALNPNTSTHTAAVLQMGAPQAVTIFNTQTGAVLQTYSTGSKAPIQTAATTASPIRRMACTCCSARTATLYGPTSSFVAIANVNPATGMLSDYAQVSVPMDVNSRRRI